MYKELLDAIRKSLEGNGIRPEWVLEHIKPVLDKQKIYEYHMCWRYSSENWEVGIVKAENKESAEKILRNTNPDAISINIYDTITGIPDNSYYTIYSK